MPIKGLSDRGLAFPEIGHIRKGAPKTENSIGMDLKYFRVEFDANDLLAKEAFLKAYPGGQPTKLNIVLPFNEIDKVWDTWLEAYTAGRLVARTDGEYFIYWIDTATGEVKVRNGYEVLTGNPVPYTEGMSVGKDYRNNPVYCKPVGRLRVVLPELIRMAFLTVLTGSKHDIINLSNQLRAIEALCLQVGKNGIGGVPLVLCRRPVKISCPEIGPDKKPTGKRVRREKWLLSVEADPEFVKRALITTKQLALPGNGLLLPQPLEPIEEIHAEEVDEVEEEKFLDEQQAEPAAETVVEPQGQGKLI